MKKYFAIILCFLLMFSGCGEITNTSSPSSSSIKEENEKDIIDEYAKEGYDQLLKLNDVMRGKTTSMLLNDDGGKVADLWTYGGYLTAVAILLKAMPQNKDVREIALNAIDELKWYKCIGKDAYASSKGLERPVFFDDNAWIVYGLLEIYGIFKDEKILKQAEKVQQFIYTGWQEDTGGILWREFDKDKTAPGDFVRNTCINAPTAMNSAILYKYTNDKKYLDWAEKIFKWTESTLKNKGLGTYYDDIDKNGEIGKSQFTYNSGCMISAGALLYDITKKNYYLDEVAQTMEGSLALFSHKHINPNVKGDFYSDNSWFRTYLFLGYLDAFSYCNKEYNFYLQGAIDGYKYAKNRNYYDKKGFLYDSWDGSKKPEDKGDKVAIKAREVAGNIQSLAIFSLFEKANKK